MKHAILGLFLALPLAAAAQDFSYDYVEGGYGHAESDDNRASIDYDAAALALGWAPAEHVYTRFGASYADVDDSQLDIRALSATVGGRVPLGGNLDLYAGALAAYQRYSDVGFDSDLDGSGLGAEIGLRSRLFPQLELEVNGTFLDLLWGDIDDYTGDTNDFTGTLAARFYATPALSIGGAWSYAFDSETETLSGALRYDF